MKASIYLNYTTRSLLRGGQRTILAIFCIAVGVMSIVALQLVGEMINSSLTGNVRDANGGDISVASTGTSAFKKSDLDFFATLKSQGTITDYTATSAASGSIGIAASATQHFSLRVVDPATFPIVTPPRFTSPADGRVSDLLKGDRVIIDQSFADQYEKKVGDRFDVHISTSGQGAINIPVVVAGIAANQGLLASLKGVMFISEDGYHTAAPDVAFFYDTVYIATIDKSHMDQAAKEIKKEFQLYNTYTTDDALKSVKSQVDFIKKFLDIAGLLALLIGGVGIVNTMQVLLSRRKIEIAMLKTVGYRRFDLYLLFGLEAGLLGLIGGVVGALAATGLSALVLNILANLFQITVPFQLDPVIVGGGVLIGLCTALIFGLLPIVQSANIRPLNVIREITNTNRVGSTFLTIGLLLILSILFCLMAVFILNDVWLGIGAVYGTFVFLGLLSLFFVLIVWLIGILPVPEKFSIGYLSIVFAGIIVSALLALVLPAFGILMLLISLMGIVIVLLPRSWKANTKMALRNIGRQRARTTTTLLALFVGVFTIGLILVLGQDLRDQLNSLIANNLSFNVVAITRGDDGSKLHDGLPSLVGLSHKEERPYAQVVPKSIDDQSIATLLTAPVPKNVGYSLPPSVTLIELSSVEGYDIAHQQFPDTTKKFTIAKGNGRNLNATDVGTDNVLVNALLSQLAPLKGHIHLGSKIMLASEDGKTSRTVTVVGFYQTSLSSDYGTILTPAETTLAFSPTGQNISVFYMKIDGDKVGKAINAIGKATPNATVLNYANIGDYLDQYIGNILLVLTAIASLSLLAGIVIIANAVALAMLERRRELGILKSVGYTSQTVLGEVLVENAVVGGTGALLAMLLVTLATSVLDKFVFKSGFGVNWYIAIGLIIGVSGLAIVTATMVAWGSVRVRPLEVLRYE